MAEVLDPDDPRDAGVISDILTEASELIVADMIEYFEETGRMFDERGAQMCATGQVMRKMAMVIQAAPGASSGTKTQGQNLPRTE